MKTKEQRRTDQLGLISLERSEVFDLLIHSLENQRENIILSGEKGIGKTSFLKLLCTEVEDKWTLCFFQGSSPLSFSDIKKRLRLAIKAQNSLPVSEDGRLQDLLSFYAEHQQKIILILDHSARLLSGFMDGLIDYSSKYPALKIIFVLTKKELALKNKTDKTIDNCYFIDIPALDKQQLPIFLQMLAVSPHGLITAQEIDEKLLNYLYPRSQGIPGKVIEALKKRKKAWFKGKGYVLIALFTLSGAGLISFFYPTLKLTQVYQQFFKLHHQLNPLDKLPIKIRKIEKMAEKQQKIPLPQQPVKAIDNERSVTPPKKIEPIADKKLLLQPPPLKSIPQENEAPKFGELKPVIVTIQEQKPTTRPKNIPIQIKPLEVKKKKPRRLKPKYKDHRQWALQQSSRRYTLQVMNIIQKRALSKVLKKYSSLKKYLKYVHVIRKGQSQYLLLYGSFPSARAARQKITTLPQEFRGAWVKPFRSLHKEIKKNNQ